MSPRVPLPPQAKLARWAVRYGPMLAPIARRMYEQGRFRQLAILHARTIVDGTFSWEMADGERVWVVWSGDEVVATYPELRHPREGVFDQARPERRRDPDDVVVRRVRRRLSDMPRPALPERMRTGNRDQDAGTGDGEA